MFAYVMCVWWVRVRCLKLDPLASMGWFVAAWALLAVAPGPYEPEARYGFPSGNVSSIPDFPVTLDGTSRAVFRLDEICSSNCAPRVEGFNFSPPSAAATTAPAAHGLSDVSQHASPSVRDLLVVVLDRFVPLSGQIPPPHLAPASYFHLRFAILSKHCGNEIFATKPSFPRDQGRLWGLPPSRRC